MNKVSIDSVIIKNAKRIVTYLRLGSKDVQNSHVVAPQGIDSCPVKGRIGVHENTSRKGQSVMLGVINEHSTVEEGEIKMFAEDDNEVVMFIHIKKDGTIEIGGDADNLVKFEKLKEVITEIQTDINNLKNLVTTWAPIANDGGAALKAVLATWQGAALTKNIDEAKSEIIKVS